MRQRPHEAPEGPTRKDRIDIQRDDVANASQVRAVALVQREIRRGVTRQQTIERLELPSLAFQGHPDALGCVEAPRAMEDVKRLGRILLIETADLGDEGRQDVLVR